MMMTLFFAMARMIPMFRETKLFPCPGVVEVQTKTFGCCRMNPRLKRMMRKASTTGSSDGSSEMRVVESVFLMCGTSPSRGMVVASSISLRLCTVVSNI